MRQEVPAPLLRAPKGVESGSQLYSSTSDRYYYAAEPNDGEREMYDTSGYSRDLLSRDGAGNWKRLNDSQAPVIELPYHSETHQFYDLIGGVELNADTTHLPGYDTTGGDGHSPEDDLSG